MPARTINTHIHTSNVLERRIEYVPIGKLKPRKDNARTHSNKQIGQIANSIRHFGWTYPILVDERLSVLCGHGRLLAAISLDLKEVPVIILRGLSEGEKRALVLADNKIAANAGWDREVLASVFGKLELELPDIGLTLDITGFEMAEIDDLRVSFDDHPDDSADAAPEPEKKPVTCLDDVWQLGSHRLVCGDSRNERCYAALMGRERAAAVISDPPYNLRVKSFQGRGKIKHREFAHASGEMSQSEFTEFLRQWMLLAVRYSVDGSLHYIFMDWKHLLECMTAGQAVYSEQKNLIVWGKVNAGQGSHYRSQHELVLLFKNGNAPHQNNIQLGRYGRSRSNLWSYPGVNSFRSGRIEELSAHPSPKPVAMIADAMRDCTRRAEIILDPFVGSGTVFIAAERVGRRAYGIEIDPLYCDVGIRRWQDFTKRDAILISTSQTFTEVQHERAMERSKE